jgi:hypothetical protein
LERDDGFACPGAHGESGLAFVEDIEAGGGVSLTEESAVLLAEDGGGLLFERLDQFRIAEECCGVEVHLRPPWKKAGN